MANAFQDQLLKAGLVSKDKLNKANKSKHKQAKQKPKTASTDTDEIKQQAKQAALEKATRDRELNRQRLGEENKKAINAQIRQLVEMNRIAESDGDIAYNFEDQTKVKRIFVTDELRRQIISGRVAIVRLGAGYALVPKAVAAKIIQRDASFVVHCNEADQSGAIAGEIDDEYADYKVPDDLMW